MSVHVNIACDVSEVCVHNEAETTDPLDLEQIVGAFYHCLVQIDEKLEGKVDVPMLATSKALEMIGVRLDSLAKSLNGTRTKRQRELARVCVVLSEELATESMRHDKS